MFGPQALAVKQKQRDIGVRPRRLDLLLAAHETQQAEDMSDMGCLEPTWNDPFEPNT